MIREQSRTVSSGYLMLVVLTVAPIGSGYAIYRAVLAQSLSGLAAAILASVARGD